LRSFAAGWLEGAPSEVDALAQQQMPRQQQSHHAQHLQKMPEWHQQLEQPLEWRQQQERQSEHSQDHDSPGFARHLSMLGPRFDAAPAGEAAYAGHGLSAPPYVSRREQEQQQQQQQHMQRASSSLLPPNGGAAMASYGCGASRMRAGHDTGALLPPPPIPTPLAGGALMAGTAAWWGPPGGLAVQSPHLPYRRSVPRLPTTVPFAAASPHQQVAYRPAMMAGYARSPGLGV